MLLKIFLLKSKNSRDLNNLDIYSYPEDINNQENNDILLKIVQGHDHKSLKAPCVGNNQINKGTIENKDSSNPFVISNPVSQVIDDLNLYTICINSEMLIGLIFEKDDNPLDYKELFEDLTSELLNSERCCSFEGEMEIENFLITLFIDIRRFGDEILENALDVYFQPSGLFTKVFLFGIDNVGKTSLTRRLKTGQYTDNYYTPNKRFNIEYIQKEDGLLSIWDSPGQSSFRERWLMGLQDSNIIIYMIDVANQLRFEESKKEFWNIMNQNEFKEIPLLILGNKIDLINYNDHNNNESLERTKNEIIQFFEFENLDNFEWKFLFTSVKTSYNIEKLLSMIFTLVSE
ncbi:MAG: ADP-ribosylation factor-like protein [Candidatus Hermodarchaeota archaeon]